jgi:hypothetical protein
MNLGVTKSHKNRSKIHMSAKTQVTFVRDRVSKTRQPIQGRRALTKKVRMDPVVKLVIEIAGILLLGALGEFIFARTRVPDVVWLVTAGILAGPVSGFVPTGLLTSAIPFLGAIALTVILSSGASRLPLTEVAAAAPRGIFLGLSGFVFSLIAVCGFFWLATASGISRGGSRRSGKELSAVSDHVESGAMPQLDT